MRKIAADISESDAYNNVLPGTSDDRVGQIEDYRRLAATNSC